MTASAKSLFRATKAKRSDDQPTLMTVEQSRKPQELVPTEKLNPPKPGTEEHKIWSAIHRAAPGPDRWKVRSKTFAGMAGAWADQWGGWALGQVAA